MSLVVYKSSAGSGKTTTLVNEYLKIALKDPYKFRHILAITFTNKAANEMKERVIETLQNLANPHKQPENKLDDLISALNLDPEIINIRAQILLSLIIHNYDEFAISTIDSFIHRIIRTFATDVQLPQNFEVVIDDDEIIPDIIQNLYDKVGKDKELTKVLINFVLSEADEENNYDPTSKLVEFIKRNMNEDSFQHVSKLDNLSIIELGDIIKRIKKRIATDKAKIIKYASACIDLCNNNNLEISDFYSGTRGILPYFIKLSQFNVPDDKLFPGKNVQKTINEDRWFGSKATSVVKNGIESIQSELTDYYHRLQEIITSYFFYRLLYSKIYSLALVHEIKNLFTEFTEQTGKVHISEFNKMISNEIADQPIPFIYERLGRRYRHFLIDEFQDTSILQWYNLLPLIEESLAHKNFNMLVGDAKQAIYRFRNGEVELFSRLPDLYKSDGSQLSVSRQNLLKSEYDEVILSNNWRSDYEIIKFNNDFFKIITESLSNRTKLIYSKHEQKIPDNKKEGGFVSLNFIEENIAEDYERKKLESIKSFIEELTENGYEEEDICILCRTKRSAISIAEFLLENRFNVVSSESLLLINSPKVRLIIAFFQLINYPDDEIAIAELVRNYEAINPESGEFNDRFMSIRDSKKNGIAKIFDELDIDAVPNDIIALSTYEIAEFVLRKIINQNSSDIFIQYLLDFIIETRLPLDKFISKWEDKKNNLFITMPEDVKAIQIMTIHKAKGLDFPAVIVDAANIKNQNTKSEYWEDLQLDDISELKVGLLPLNKKIENINRGDIYEEEVSKTELDFVNLMYVAFTRPKKALYTIAQIKNGRQRDKFSDFLVNYLKTKKLWENEKYTYNYGELKQKKSESDKDNTSTIKLNSFITTDWQELISIAISEDLINDELLTKISPSSYGNLIHKILSKINTANDISIAIKQIRTSGLIGDSDLEIIEKTLVNVINYPKLIKYYKPGLLIKNETELLLENGEIIRPDRVILENEMLTIIDYKTGEEKKQDFDQLRKYMEAFKELGYKNIAGKLVYIGDIIKVVDIE